MSQNFWIRLGLGLAATAVLWLVGVVVIRIADGDWDFHPRQVLFGFTAVFVLGLTGFIVLGLGEGLGRLFGLFNPQ